MCEERQTIFARLHRILAKNGTQSSQKWNQIIYHLIYKDLRTKNSWNTF